MSPFANYYVYMVAGLSIMGVFVGALGGAVLANTRVHWILGGALTAVAFAVTEAVTDDPHILLRLWSFGAPTLAVSYLASYAAARWLRTKTSWHTVWVTLLALVFGLFAGCADHFVYRFHPRAPAVVAAIVVAFFAFIWIRRRASGGAAGS